MNPEKDAYGNVLYDIHSGNNPNAGEIIERDDGYIEYAGSARNYFSEYSEWKSQTQEAIQHAFGSAVDIGCGAGRHSLYLQENTTVTPRGIDTSPKAVKVTKERGVDLTSTAGLKDVASLPEAPYETVIMLGNNLGLLGTEPIENLCNLAEATTDDAVLIGQTRQATATDNPAHLQYHEFNKSRGRRPGCIRLRIRYKMFTSDWYNYLYVNFDSLQTILTQTPWEVEERYHDGGPMYTVVLTK